MSRVTAAVKSVLSKLLSLVRGTRAAKAHACSKVVCIKTAKKSKGAKKSSAQRKSAKSSKK